MELKRRFIFHGDAVAIGGRIVRPQDIILDPGCASTLPVTGGRTSSSTKGKKFGRYVQFAAASTLAQGLFDDRKQLIALTNGEGREEQLTSTTIVRADLRGLIVGIDPQLTVRRLRGSLTAKSPSTAEGETGVSLGTDTSIDGVAIGRHRLIIELNTAPFQEHVTYSALRDRGGVTLVESRGTIHATIVRSIRWSGKPYPGAEIDGHLVTVPKFGRIYFGEILISRDSRRVTLMRLELGSPFGGSMACSDYQDNGGWSP
jgi:hypothetical protein